MTNAQGKELGRVLVLVLYLLLLYGGTKKSQPGPSSDRTVERNSIRAAYLADVFDSFSAAGEYSSNVTGVYTGTWAVFNASNTTHQDMLGCVEQIDKSSNGTVRIVSAREFNPRLRHKPGQLGLSRDSGQLRLQLKTSASTVPDVHVVGGIVNFIDGETRTRHDFGSLLHGFYLPKFGAVGLYTDNPDRSPKAKTVGVSVKLNGTSPLWNSTPALPSPITNRTTPGNFTTVWDARGLVPDSLDLIAADSRSGYSEPLCDFRFDVTPSLRNETVSPGDLAPSVRGSPPALRGARPLVDSEATPPIADQHNMTHFSGIAVSENCNVTLALSFRSMDVDIAKGHKLARNFAEMAIYLSLIQIFDVARLLQRTSARLAFLSAGTVAIMGVTDAYLCLFFMSGGFVIKSTLLFTVAGFIKSFLFSGLELRLIIMILNATNPETYAGRQGIRLVFSRFYAAIVGGSALILYVPFLRPLMVAVLFSFWVPQIVQNVVNDVQGSFGRRFVLESSISRLVIPLYFLLTKRTFLMYLSEDPGFSTYSPRGAGLLVAWMLLQVATLESQRYLGARWFVPQRFLPVKYEYQRPIPESLRQTECVVCMLPVSGIDEASYMVTPCNHLFHASCLEPWMQVKLSCPTCRRPLPAI